MRTLSPLIGLALFWSSTLLAEPTQYVIDKNQTAINLTWYLPAHHPSQAALSTVSGQIIFNPEDTTADKIDVSIPFSTLDAHNSLLTKELKSSTFFDVTHYPDAHFISANVIAKGDGHYWVSGILQIKQIKKYVVLDAEVAPQTDKNNTESLVFHATTQILRSAFDMDSYLYLVDDSVAIDISLKASRALGVSKRNLT